MIVLDDNRQQRVLTYRILQSVVVHKVTYCRRAIAEIFSGNQRRAPKVSKR